MKRLHIVGCPRSGTTLLMELMAGCFENDGHCDHELSLFTPPPGAPELFLSKQPSDICYLKPILLRDPNLFSIGLQRDPRSVITSVHKARPGVYYCNYAVWKECQQAAEDLDGHPRFLLVRYEQLTQDPDRVQTLIMNRFPFLSKKHPFSAYTQFAKPSPDAANALGGVRAISSDRQKSWEAHLPRVKEQCQRHPQLVQDLIRLGYEPDLTWLSRLNPVQAQRFPCRYPDKPPTLKRLETRIRKYFQSRSYLARHQLG